MKRSKLVYTSIRNTLKDYVPTIKDKLFKCLVTWLEENNLFIHTDYCDFFTLTYKEYDDFVESHNFVINRKQKQLTFNDLIFYERCDFNA